MSERVAAPKSPDAFRTISEVADELRLPQHVLRFWETRFPQVKPLKRAGGRRFYRPEDVDLLRAVKTLLYRDGYTIKGVQRLLREEGPVAAAGRRDAAGQAPDVGPVAADDVGPVPAARRSPGTIPPAAGGEAGAPAEPGAAPSGTGAAPGGTGVAGRLRAALRDLDDCAALLARARTS